MLAPTPDSLNNRDLFDATYDELRRLTHSLFKRERRGHTLQPTAVVHEAYLRLSRSHPGQFESREQFLGYAVRVIRQVLVDAARKHDANKRGGDLCRVTLEGISVRAATTDPTVLDVDLALDELETLDPGKARVVELRYFGGLTIEECAELLEVSVSTVNREWRSARAWLLQRLSQAES